MKVFDFWRSRRKAGKPASSDISDQEPGYVTPMAGWVITAVLLEVSWFLVLAGRPWWAVAVFFLTIIFIGDCLEEVTAPDHAVYLRLGKFIGLLKPGTYLIPSHLWGVKRATMTLRSIEIDRQSLYAKATPGYSEAPTEFFGRVRPYWRYTNLRLAFDSFGLDEKEIVSRITTGTLESLRIATAQKDVPGNLEGQEGVRDHILKAVRGTMESTGIEVPKIDLYDIDELVITKAGETEASAVAEGKRAEALAGPLKGNPEAAQVQVASIYTTAATGLPHNIARAAVEYKREGGRLTGKREEAEAEAAKSLIDRFLSLLPGR